MLGKIFKRSVWTVVSLFFIILLVITTIAETAVLPYVTWIDDYMGVRRTFLENDENAEQEDTNYYPSKFYDGCIAADFEEEVTNVDSWYKLHKKAYAVSRQVNEEGMVLLWNKNNALPVDPATEKNVSTFGIMGLSHKDGNKWVDNWAYHATGSANVDLRNQTDDKVDGVSILPNVPGYPELDVGPRLSKSLEKYDFNVNPNVIESTWVNGDKSQMNGYEKRKYTKEEVTWETLQGDTANDPIGSTVNQYNDLVLYTVGRWTGEGQTEEKGNRAGVGAYLTEKEKGVLKGLSDLRAAGSIKKLVVIIAYANPMDINDFKNYNIDAAIWAGNGGNTATDSVVSMITGNAVPSGKLVDTWAYDNQSAPAAVNYGYFTYDDPDKLIFNDYQENIDAYLVYQEGIYVGYRYYETRYEDYVLGKGGANSSKGVVAGSGEWNYGKEVAYPFGYGASYTTFSYSDYSVKKNGSDYEVSVTVTNEGAKYSGKETVQIYLQKPYTAGGIEKASVELVGYAKTDVLAPKGKEGDSQVLTITVPEYEFKSYDADNAKTYIIEKGDYYIAAGANAHDAINNILAKKGSTPANTSGRMDAEGNAGLVEKFYYNSTYDYENPYGDIFDNKVTNQFDDIDINKFDGIANKVAYLSRNNWNGTYPTAPAALKATAKIAAGLSNDKPVTVDPAAVMPTFGSGKEEDYTLNLIQLKDVPFNDPLWGDLLGTLTYEDMIELLTRSMAPITGIAANAGKVYDGPLGCRDAWMGDLGARCALPCAPVLAATYNDELIQELSDVFADLNLMFGRSGIWGISTNIHRTPYNGRNNEYYSEDSFLSGRVCAEQVEALTTRGIIVYTKHMALNNYEAARVGVNTWANEQSVREIYLKAFEESITEAGGNGIMTSYNRIGTTWTGAHKGLLVNVLQKEWGFTGVTCTDYGNPVFKFMGSTAEVVANAVIAGQDEWIAGLFPKEELLSNAAYRNSATFCAALRDLAHRNLFTRVHTAAMNGVGSTTRVVIVMPAWQQAITGLKIASAVVTGVTLAGVAAAWVLWYLDKRKKTA